MNTTILDSEVAHHVLWHYGHYDPDKKVGYQPGTFVESLIKTIARADPGNRLRLMGAFPNYVVACTIIETTPDGVEVLEQMALGGTPPLPVGLDARLETLSEAGRRLHAMAVERFDEHGPLDPRGAALWDAGCYLVETIGDGDWRGRGPDGRNEFIIGGDSGGQHRRAEAGDNPDSGTGTGAGSGA